MKTLCKNRTPEEQIRLCKTINILLAISILLMIGVSIYDFALGLGIDASRTAIFCSDICILCLNIRNLKDAQARLENDDNNK